MSRFVEIEEMSATWGCSWNFPGQKTQYGWGGFPEKAPKARSFLESSGGRAVQNIVNAAIGAVVIKTSHGAYGGRKRKISVELEMLENFCMLFWERENNMAKKACSGTRYDESCSGCRRITAICNNCELCEKCHA